MIKILLFALLISVSFVANSNNYTPELYHKKLYVSYINNDNVEWENTLKQMMDIYKTEGSDELLYDILLAYYGLIGYYIEFDSKVRGGEFLGMAGPYLKKLFDAPGYQAEAYAFQAVFYGFEISINNVRGASLGPRSNSAIDQAMKLNENYPRIWVEKGNISFYSPPRFGGSFSDAIDHYSKAIQMYEKNLPANHRWIYLNTLIFLAKSYEKTGNIAEAIVAVNKALAYEPNLKWAKETYLPHLNSLR